MAYLFARLMQKKINLVVHLVSTTFLMFYSRSLNCQ